MKNFIIRSLTAILFVTVMLGAILYSPYTYAVLMVLVTILALREFYTLVKDPNEKRSTSTVDIIGGTYLVMGIFLLLSGIVTDDYHRLFGPYLLYLFYTFVIQLFNQEENPIQHWAYSLLGQVYIALPFGLLSYISFPPSIGMGAYNPLLLIAFFALIWSNDTGAYCVGVTLGKHRMIERISPKKSWEGFVGGVSFAIIAAILFSFFLPMLTRWQWIGLGVIISLSATLGDLCESLLKRTIHIKDSGALLPGHGGILDRFDSVLLAAPATVIYLIYIL